MRTEETLQDKYTQNKPGRPRNNAREDNKASKMQALPLSSKKVSLPATRALEQLLGTKEPSIASAAQGKNSRKKCSYDRSAMFQAASSAMEEHALDFPPIEWCHDEDDDICYYGNIKTDLLIFSSSSSKRRKNFHSTPVGEADAERPSSSVLVRSKAFPSSLVRLSEGRALANMAEPCNNQYAHRQQLTNNHHLLTSKVSMLDHHNHHLRRDFENPIKNHHALPSSSLNLGLRIGSEE